MAVEIRHGDARSIPLAGVVRCTHLTLGPPGAVRSSERLPPATRCRLAMEHAGQAGSEGETVATQHQKSQPESTSDEDQRAKSAQALELVREWLADESGYDERVFPVLKAELEADRLSYRRRFKE